MLGRDDYEELALEVSSSVVSFLELGGVKPSISSQNCSAFVQTFNHNQVRFNQGFDYYNLKLFVLNYFLIFSFFQSRSLSNLHFYLLKPSYGNG